MMVAFVLYLEDRLFIFLYFHFVSVCFDNNKNRREQWHLFSSYASWQHLVAQTKRQARDHALLSDIYANTVIQRLGQVTEEVQRIYRRVSCVFFLCFLAVVLTK